MVGVDEVDMGIDSSGGEDLALSSNGFGTGTHQDVHTHLCIRVAGLADARDAPILDPHVGLDDSPVVQDFLGKPLELAAASDLQALLRNRHGTQAAVELGRPRCGDQRLGARRNIQLDLELVSADHPPVGAADRDGRHSPPGRRRAGP